jgi:hypothetical protein
MEFAPDAPRRRRAAEIHHEQQPRLLQTHRLRRNGAERAPTSLRLMQRKAALLVCLPPRLALLARRTLPPRQRLPPTPTPPPPPPPPRRRTLPMLPHHQALALPVGARGHMAVRCRATTPLRALLLCSTRRRERGAGSTASTSATRSNMTTPSCRLPSEGVVCCRCKRTRDYRDRRREACVCVSVRQTDRASCVGRVCVRGRGECGECWWRWVLCMCVWMREGVQMLMKI